MNERTASVHWEGPGKTGQGQINTDTGALTQYPFWFASRSQDNRRATNPEELLGAAHAACFTMAFSFACNKAGFATVDIDTKANVRLRNQGDGFAIDRIALFMQATAPGTDEEKFQMLAAMAKRGCPLSKALTGVAEITMRASLR